MQGGSGLFVRRAPDDVLRPLVVHNSMLRNPCGVDSYVLSTGSREVKLLLEYIANCIVIIHDAKLLVLTATAALSP